MEAAVEAVGPPPAEPWRRPRPVGVLAGTVSIEAVRHAVSIDTGEWFLPVGIGDAELAPAGFLLGEGDHALVAGPPRSGKSTALATLGALASAAGVAVTAFTVRSSPLSELPDPCRLVTSTQELGDAVATLGADGPALLLIDDADLVDDLDGTLAALVRERRPNVRIVASGRGDALRTLYGHFTQELRRSRQGLALRPNPDADGELWQVMLPRRGPTSMPPGRGYLVSASGIELVQTALAP